MKTFFILLLSLLTGCSTAKQPEVPSAVPDIPYQAIENLIGTDVKPALIIYLHSNSGSGTDNKKQMNQASVSNIEKYIKDNNIPAYPCVFPCAAVPDRS